MLLVILREEKRSKAHVAADTDKNTKKCVAVCDKKHNYAMMHRNVPHIDMAANHNGKI